MHNVDPKRLHDFFSNHEEMTKNDPFVTEFIKIKSIDSNTSHFYCKVKVPFMAVRDMVFEIYTLKNTDGNWFIGTKPVINENFPQY